LHLIINPVSTSPKVVGDAYGKQTKTMKRIITFVIALAISSFGVINAQTGKIKFEKTTHDFGTLKEEINKASVKFNFTNVGTGDLKIVNVRASCGCTATDYTKGVIKPGGKGYVVATYFTKGRPGPFRKSITVTTNDVDSPNRILFIKGKVIPKPKNPGDLLPITIGNLKLENNHLAFNVIKSTEVRKDSIKIYNKYGHPMTLNFMQVPPSMKIEAHPSTLPSGKLGYIVVTYDAAKRNDFGLLFDRIAIKTNDNVQPIKILTISANIVEDFSKLTPKELKKAPVISFDNTDYDFGKVKSGEAVTYSFTFRNEGKRDLIIRKTKSSCGCTATAPADKVIKKGKSSKIDIRFDTHGRVGRQHKTVTVITNDPAHPQIILNVHGEVVK
jgi:hypothetical protein